uniref:Uncharacterized protein LOC114331650 n=1 Tax=Diabrotica virgifera virgifera TaxID=50390 RepID=A0A6P7FVZ3_DIAVI
MDLNQDNNTLLLEGREIRSFPDDGTESSLFQSHPQRNVISAQKILKRRSRARRLRRCGYCVLALMILISLGILLYVSTLGALDAIKNNNKNSTMTTGRTAVQLM